MVAPAPIPHRYRGLALTQQGSGWLNSLGNDRSDSHRCPRGPARAGPPPTSRLTLTLRSSQFRFCAWTYGPVDWTKPLLLPFVAF